MGEWSARKGFSACLDTLLFLIFLEGVGVEAENPAALGRHLDEFNARNEASGFFGSMGHTTDQIDKVFFYTDGDFKFCLQRNFIGSLEF